MSRPAGKCVFCSRGDLTKSHIWPEWAQKVIPATALSAAEIAAGPDDTNTQVTTIVVGRLCAHIFSSTVYDDFAGYVEPPMCRIWPITGFDIDTGYLPEIDAEDATWLHEAIGRDRNPPDRFRRQG